MTVGLTLLTVPEELLEHAQNAHDYFIDHGYTVKPEPTKLEYPNTPTLLAKRARRSVFVEVVSKLDASKARTWAGYGKSCGQDTRIMFVVPDDMIVRAKDERAIEAAGVGIIVSGSEGVYEKLSARDQAVAVGLPELQTLPLRVRRAVAPVYEKFDRDWQDGFKDACTLVEVEARRRLIRDVNSGRVQFLNAKGQTPNLTVVKIDKMPAGSLADAYSMIASPNQTDKTVEQALRQLNQDRVGAVHLKARAETRLRKNVGKHMFVVLNTLKEIDDER